MASSMGGAPSIGGDPTAAVLGVIVIVIVAAYVVWKVAF